MLNSLFSLVLLTHSISEPGILKIWILLHTEGSEPNTMSLLTSMVFKDSVSSAVQEISGNISSS